MKIINYFIFICLVILLTITIVSRKAKRREDLFEGEITKNMYGYNCNPSIEVKVTINKSNVIRKFCLGDLCIADNYCSKCDCKKLKEFKDNLVIEVKQELGASFNEVAIIPRLKEIKKCEYACKKSKDKDLIKDLRCGFPTETMGGFGDLLGLKALRKYLTCVDKTEINKESSKDQPCFLSPSNYISEYMMNGAAIRFKCKGICEPQHPLYEETWIGTCQKETLKNEEEKINGDFVKKAMEDFAKYKKEYEEQKSKLTTSTKPKVVQKEKSTSIFDGWKFYSAGGWYKDETNRYYKSN